jgi:periplasmic divalent cation tolerance protein
MTTDYCIVITTFSDDSNGKKIVDALIEQRLAACIQVIPMQSFYHWKGQVNCDEEKLMLIKTKRSLYEKVQDSIVANHDYDTPEIIQVSIQDGFPGYLNWIADECQ